MPQDRIRVAVIYGGMSTEHSISCISAAAVMGHLDREVYDVIPVGITASGTWTVGVDDPTAGCAPGTLPQVPDDGQEITLSPAPARRGQLCHADGTVWQQVDVIFPVLHGPFGEDGTIQGLFELSGVPYVGNGVLASACSMDKEYTKKISAAAGLPVTPEVVVRDRGQLSDKDQQRLGLPVFVKPARGGSSIGVSKVTDWSAVPAAIDAALAVDSKAIVEAEVVGKEVEVGVLEYPDGRVVASAPALLQGTGDSPEGFYGFDTKYLDNVVSAQIPADLPDETIRQLQEMAVRTFHALDCRGLARVDFFVTDSGPVLNEINTMPGFTAVSMYPQVFAAGGVDYAQLLDIMVRTALNAPRR
ncbi:D-alanine--D-alanine ligase family protein [Corynebacterium uberis]|uniref:D-alanine--D-alanine ligase family protein n=1 Tax=Corynebacterium TaxID=1716 RepID=UPI001D0AE15A|nr:MULTISPECIES: D-alanine--D-alanine ligase family protein [Corynebacterium]MCZ9309132.1 D-alanine--D-alanine ligase [Corynebacterium sp. c6VSa_13]UDL74406.1 D-alanine--D-alanine ligase [Corynebacterium uberis]UDL76760.1 D-alanine--D-alanine ligase [Corynebacterium uberis]UDL78973.1 D-alanine--D-alanine ligase [Corynebacterium uberis]UDL81250.1 D-alanine--D-alanine ligase [Corynebacterium uberis]